MVKNSLTDRSRLILPDLEKIATQTELVVRKSSKFSPAGFLQSLISAVISGKASCNQIASQLKHCETKSMSAQALHQRLGVASTSFLLQIIFALTKQQFKPTAQALKNSSIKRLIIEDSTSIRLPKSNAQDFAAHGNAHGPTAGSKINLAYDLLSSTVISHSLHLATTQDKTIGPDLLEEIKKDDLILRDMGYFSLNIFSEIEEKGAYWLTRLPVTTGILLENEKSLESQLRPTKNTLIDELVYVGEERKPCRLIAVRADKETAKKRRAQRKKIARQKGKKSCPKALLRDGWHLMLTNLSKEEIGSTAPVGP